MVFMVKAFKKWGGILAYFGSNHHFGGHQSLEFSSEVMRYTFKKVWKLLSLTSMLMALILLKNSAEKPDFCFAQFT